MIVYRLTRTKFAYDISGEGARLNGGRWNHKGISVVYASESRSLALLEYTVNVNIDDIPRALSIVAIEIPGDIHIVGVSELPGNWRVSPAPGETKDYGTNLLRKVSQPVIKIPSAVILNECNYLLNPLHRKSHQFKITSVEDFIFDVRIKTK